MVEDLIRRARRRFVVNESLGQLAFACAFAAGGVALILLVGTRFLEWWTLALFAAAGLGIGAARAWKAAPDEYSTAVKLDADANLHDVLSTAYYFSNHESEFPESEALVRTQADEAAKSVDLETAVPFTFPRALYALAALVVLASAMIGVRLIARHSLDLQAPITEILFEDLAAKQEMKKKQAGNALDRKRLETAESLLAKLGLAPNPEDQKQDAAALDKAIDQALDGAAALDKGQKGDKGKFDDGKAGNGEKPANGDPLDGKPTDSGDPNAENKPSGQDGAPGDKGASKNSSGENSSLMSKLKDAVSNMFSKPKQDSTGQKSQQQGQMAKSDKANGEKGSQGKNQDQGQAQADAQDGEPNSDSQDGQQAQGKAGSKSAQSSAQAGSGVGSQDGAKDLKAAEQLKAMGKISEILGKRASTVTGETTIEVQSGNQQLRTAYSTSAATHSESDSELNRDEIPVALQPYIQQYFEQVRKAAPAAAKPK